mmetsp:Transcript_594/g.1996  ORF Transcript_594/g.1996 Transcript_594/m.1996 type:complete len:319 (+) Transcript_594:355-1311(+)|eukprot:CAMPEP_0198725292 /NCGR_PEP_ID=MMETSP1475-20131203/2629_1 /TAXON_ID= ORGANISM="Unidentified sp., Strain CCMP1999" /NCGR_SAMPLE_ID=MMETSP1475 /ASSEMBLY_ACC=CAM_ASM_001111 /LENGTH=318 /DNA_ID=CAMNT_0044487039 /DNA_START=275 /DNA_END=1231 /DNA_ORIENTATION=-
MRIERDESRGGDEEHTGAGGIFLATDKKLLMASSSGEDVEWMGRFQVTSRGPQDALFHVVAVPDMCLGAVSQYEGFLGFCAASNAVPELPSSRLHFVDLPGHAPGAAELPSDYWPKFEEIQDEFVAVVEKTSSAPRVAFGVGVGADLVRRAADAHPRLFRGLVLIAPVISSSGMLTSFVGNMASYYLSYFGWTGHVTDLLLSRWFCQETIDYNFDLRERFALAIERLRPRDAARTVVAHANRRKADDTPQHMKHIRALIICGRESPLYNDAAEALQLFPGGEASIIEPFSTGSLVTEEKPETVARSISLFLSSIVGMT